MNFSKANKIAIAALLQFVAYKKCTRSHLFHIAKEKSCDYLIINNIHTKICSAVLFWHLESEPVLKPCAPDKNCGPNGLKLLVHVLLMFVSVADFLGITSFHLWKHHLLRGTADFVHSRYFVIVFKGLQVSVACHVYNLASLEVCSLQLFNCLSGAWLENTFNKSRDVFLMIDFIISLILFTLIGCQTCEKGSFM